MVILVGRVEIFISSENCSLNAKPNQTKQNKAYIHINEHTITEGEEEDNERKTTQRQFSIFICSSVEFLFTLLKLTCRTHVETEFSN